MDEILGEAIPLAAFFMIICVVVIPIWIRFHYASRDRARLHETVRAMVEKGQPVSPEMLQSLNVAPASSAAPARIDGGRNSDMRRGVILVMVAFALIVLGFCFYYITDVVTNILIGSAAFPGFIGLGFIIMALINRPKRDV